MSKKQRVKQEHYNISNEDFVKAWQSSRSIADVLATLDVTSKYASARATSLRRQKIALKKFKRTVAPIDVKALNELAKKSLRE